MKKTLILLAFAMVSTMAIAQTTPTPPPASTPAPAVTQSSEKTLAGLLDWLIGSWEGEGMAGGKSIQQRMTVVPQLDEAALLLTRESIDPSVGLKELMVIGYDVSTKQIIATYFNNRNKILLYKGEEKPDGIDFSLAAQAPGYVRHWVLRKLPGGLVGLMIEGSDPGKPMARSVEINFKKKI